MRVRQLSVGPIIGVTTKTSVRLWGRGDAYPLDNDYHRVFGVAQVQLSANNIRTQFFKMLPNFDFTGIIDFKQLKVNRAYRYRVGYVLAELEPEDINKLRNTSLEWDDSDWHEFRTNPGDNSNISFLLGSCRYLSRLQVGDNRGDKTFRSALSIIDNNPVDAVIMVGDQIYADDFWKFDPDKGQEEFFKKYRNAFSQPYIRSLMASSSTYMVLDDHEIINNWNQDWIDDDENMRELLVVAMSAYHPYQVVHGPAFNPSSSSTADNRPRRLWYNFDCGRASFFTLDTRTERSLRDREMISIDQMRALKRWIRRNSDGVKFIISSVPFFPDNKRGDDDKWAGYPEQRLEILDYLAQNKIGRTVFLSGDIHASGCATLTCDQIPDFKVHQVISSPFWWPASPGNSKRFRNKSTLGIIKGNEFRVTYTNYFTDDDNFLHVMLNSNQLQLKCFGRKSKPLDDDNLQL